MQKLIPRIPTLFALVLLATLTVGPFAWLMVTALKGSGENIFAYPPTLWPESLTLDNFREVWNAVPFARYFLNSTLVAAAAVFLNLALASLAAYPLARLRFRGRNALLMIILSTMMIPLPVILIPLFILAMKLQLLNSYAGLVLPTAVSAFGIFLMRQAFAAIPRELEEAAIIDGASHWDIYLRVMLPLTKPTLATLAIFVFVGSWGDFLWPLIVLKDPSLYTLPVGISYLAGAFSANWRVIAAGSVLSILPIVVLFLALQRYFVGTTAGAIKG